MTFYAYSFPYGRLYGGTPDVYAFKSRPERAKWLADGPQAFGDAGYRQAAAANGRYVVLAKRSEAPILTANP